MAGKIRMTKECPRCGGKMDCRSRRSCRSCREIGGVAAIGSAYAAELGISVRKLRRLGGEATVRAMAPAMREILVKPGMAEPGKRRSQGYVSMKSLGMVRGVPGALREESAA